MEFPKTPDEMKAGGYTYKDQGTCKDRGNAAGCGATIDWWLTPRGKNMPTDAGTATPHWETCPNAKDHRSGDSGGGRHGGDGEAEQIAARFVRSGNCRFGCGGGAALRVQTGRDFAFLCGQHGEELRAKLNQWSEEFSNAATIDHEAREPGSDDVEPPF